MQSLGSKLLAECALRRCGGGFGSRFPARLHYGVEFAAERPGATVGLLGLPREHPPPHRGSGPGGLGIPVAALHAARAQQRVDHVPPLGSPLAGERKMESVRLPGVGQELMERDAPVQQLHRERPVGEEHRQLCDAVHIQLHPGVRMDQPDGLPVHGEGHVGPPRGRRRREPRRQVECREQRDDAQPDCDHGRLHRIGINRKPNARQRIVNAFSIYESTGFQPEPNRSPPSRKRLDRIRSYAEMDRIIHGEA